MAIKMKKSASYNTAYALRAYALALRDIAFGNVVYAGDVYAIGNNIQGMLTI